MGVISPKSCSRAATESTSSMTSRPARSTTSATSRRTRSSRTPSSRAASRATVAELVDEADVVFHLAAAVGVELIVDSPVRTIETNVHCTEIVLGAANKKQKPVFIASTSEVYGKSAELPFREDGDLLLGPTNKGRWSYACSKAIDEYLALAYWKERGLPGGDRAPVQHGRSASDRSLRDGRAVVRAAGARRRADHRPWRRSAAPLLLPRQGRGPRHGGPDGQRAGSGGGLQHRQHRGDHDHGARRAGAARVSSRTPRFG